MRGLSNVDQAISIAAYKSVFLSSTKGKDVLYDIISSCGIDDGSFIADPYQAAFSSGRRSVAIEILGRLNMDVRDVLIENVTMEDIE